MATLAAGVGDTANAEEATGIDLGGLFRFLKRRWPYIAGTAVVVALITGLALLQTTPLYSATSSVAVQSQKTQVVDIQDVMSGLTPDLATMETQVSIIKSNRLADQLATRLKLDADPEFNSALGGGGFSLLHPRSWFAARKPSDAELTPYQKAARRASIVGSVMRAFTVKAVPRSYVITIAATTRDPEKSAAMANALADLYISDGIESKYEATRRASAYLEQRTEELRQAAVSSDRAMEVYRGQSGLIGGTDGTVDTQQLSELNSQLIIARSERAAKEAQLNQIRRLAQSGGGVETSATVVDSPLIQKLREQESEVVRKLADLQATYGERHPRIINANAELRDLRAKIGEEVRKLAASTANEVQVARAREGTLAGGVGSIEGRVNRGGQANVRLRELQREADANRTIYETFLNRLKETRQQVDVQTADSRIIAPAQVPTRPSFPQIGPTLGVAIAVGLVAGVLLSIGLERLDNTVRGADAVEQMGGGSTLAFVPVVKGEYERPEDVIIERPQAMVSESLRTLRSAIALSDVDSPPKLVMLSSSVPAEGKTFVSTGLARVSAQSGARTLIIDADMRHPRVHHAFGLENNEGLVQVLSGEAPLTRAIQRDPKSGVEILTAGHGAVNPPDLLRSHHMEQLLARLRETYDFVVIDTPPFTPMTDSQILSQMVDKMLLVVRWGNTPLPVVQSTIRQIHRLKAPLVGSVLSQVNLQRQATYGYGDYGYHYARYGAYYGSQA